MARITSPSTTSKAYKTRAALSMTKNDLIKLCNAKEERYKELKKERSK